jgi:3-ketosteroid 9alpha-monooxygenase subunit B
MTTTQPTEAGVIPGRPDGPGYDLRVAQVIRETHDACSIVFEIPDELAQRFRYESGQFLTLEVRHEGKELFRCYSLASSPATETTHKVTIKRVPDGRISNWANETLKAGDVVRVLPPGGFFVLNEDSNDVHLFAAGSGITPVISIIKTALATTSREIRLVYANRDALSTIFKDELDALAAKHTDRFSLTYSMDDVDGFVSVSRAKQYVGDRLRSEFYICGPGPFMDAVEQALSELGVDDSRVHIERFVSPPDHDEAEDAQERAALSAAGDKPAHIMVYLDGATHEVPYDDGQTVLVAVQKAGLQPPFSCTDGFCGCCMARVTSGDVKMIHNDFLSKKELEQGWVLTCQSVPVTASVKVEYPD